MNLLEMQENCVRSLGREDPLEEGTATLSSILALRESHGQGSPGGCFPQVAKSWMRWYLEPSRKCGFLLTTSRRTRVSIPMVSPCLRLLGQGSVAQPGCLGLGWANLLSPRIPNYQEAPVFLQV